MAAILVGERLTPKEKSRVTLSVRSPLVTSLLAGLGVEKDHIEEVHAFGKMLERDRNRWDIDRRSSGLFGGGRLSKDAAERALALAMADLAENGGAA